MVMVHVPVIQYVRVYLLNHVPAIWYVPAIVFAVLIYVPVTRLPAVPGIRVRAFRYVQPAQPALQATGIRIKTPVNLLFGSIYKTYM